MSQDIVADALNQIINAKKARKDSLTIRRQSKLLKKILDIAKEAGYISYEAEGREIKIKIEQLNEFKAVKPRYTVSVKDLDKYVRRFLPAKNFGFIIVSTNKGLMKHDEAKKKNIGGCLIAYAY